MEIACHDGGKLIINLFVRYGAQFCKGICDNKDVAVFRIVNLESDGRLARASKPS
jgi:hypothetical protein